MKNHMQHLNGLKRLSALLCAGIMVVSATTGPVVTRAEEATEAEAAVAEAVEAAVEETSYADDTPKDFVIVIDESGSMKSSDEQGLCDEAAKMFIDMLPAENARLAVITFGVPYGSDAATLPENCNGAAKDRVKIAYQLQDITEKDAKNAAKQIILDERAFAQEKTGYTPVGYALAAANALLAANDSAPGNAAIILMSDGRVTGQDGTMTAGEFAGQKDMYQEGWHSHSVDEAVATARGNDFPIYTVEMNMDKKNDEESGSSEGNQGRTLMREDIPQNAEDHFELKDSKMAQDAYQNIYSRFFDIDTANGEEFRDSKVIADGKAEFNFNIGEMIAETTITLTGEMEKVTSVKVEMANGKVKEFDPQNDVDPEDGSSVIFDKTYTILKLITPYEGACKVTVNGSDNVEIGMFAVSIREMNLNISAKDTDGNDLTDKSELERNQKVTFVGQYVYKESPYETENVYTKYPATLIIYKNNNGVEETVAEIPMKGEGPKYTAEYDFADKGTFNARISVESNLFRENRKDSGVMTFAVASKPTKAEGSIEPIKLKLGEALSEPIHAADYFDAQDGDKLHFGGRQAGGVDTLEFSVDPETGFVSLKAGQTASVYNFIVTADDQSGEEPVQQMFEVEVVNQPLEMKGDFEDGQTLEVNLAVNADKVPGPLKAIGDVPEETVATYTFADMFFDPDGADPIITVEAEKGMSNENIASDFAEGNKNVTISATDAGEATYVITAKDANKANDQSLWKKVYVHVKAENATTLVWNTVKIPVIAAGAALLALIIALIAIFGGRKLYGIWDVTAGGDFAEDCKFASYRSGKRTKTKLNALLNDIGVNADMGNVEIAAGNNMNKLVFLKNLRGLDSVLYNGNPVDKDKVKKLALKKGSNVVLEYQNETVTLERH